MSALSPAGPQPAQWVTGTARRGPWPSTAPETFFFPWWRWQVANRLNSLHVCRSRFQLFTPLIHIYRLREAWPPLLSTPRLPARPCLGTGGQARSCVNTAVSLWVRRKAGFIRHGVRRENRIISRRARTPGVRVTRWILFERLTEVQVVLVGRECENSIQVFYQLLEGGSLWGHRMPTVSHHHIQFVGAVCWLIHPVSFFEQLKKFLHGNPWVGRAP